MSTGTPELLDAPVDPARDNVRGAPAAGAATIVEYGDYECPYSRAAFRAIERLGERLGGQLQFVFRHFPLREIHPHAQMAAEAAEEAAAQGRFWEMSELLYHRQQALEREDLRGYAREVGLDVDAFDAALADGRHRPRVQEDVDSGLRSHVDGTPTLFIDGVRHYGSYVPDELERAIATRASAR
jgi:protein-disulfide isomerase